MHKKTIILLNLRFSDFYSVDLFSAIKTQFHYRMVAIVDQQFVTKIGNHIKRYLDQIYRVESQQKSGFLGEFAIESVRPIIANEQSQCNDLRIVCTDEFNLLVAGQLRRELNLVGHTDDDLRIYRDKTCMKALIQKAGLRTPKYQTLQPEKDFSVIVTELGLPFIAKPIDSCGSHGVKIIHDSHAYACFLQTRMLAEYELEEYIDGKLYHVDSCIQDGELKFICANEYTYPNMDYMRGKTLASIPLEDATPLALSLIDFAKNCLQALKANNLINHMELFINQNQEIIFLEISGRPPGALLNLTHQINFNINLMDEDFFIQTGVTPQLVPQPLYQEKAFAALFPLIPGEIHNTMAPVVQSRSEITWFVEPGRHVDYAECQNIVSKAAHGIFYHANYQTLRDDFDRIKHHQAVEIITC